MLQLADSGIELKVSKGPNGTQTITIIRHDGSETMTETITTSVSKATTHSGSKRARIDTNYKKELEVLLGNINDWFEKTETNLELLTTEPNDPQDQLTLEEQLVLVQVRDLLMHFLYIYIYIQEICLW